MLRRLNMFLFMWSEDNTPRFETVVTRIVAHVVTRSSGELVTRVVCYPRNPVVTRPTLPGTLVTISGWACYRSVAHLQPHPHPKSCYPERGVGNTPNLQHNTPHP